MYVWMDGWMDGFMYDLLFSNEYIHPSITYNQSIASGPMSVTYAFHPFPSLWSVNSLRPQKSSTTWYGESSTSIWLTNFHTSQVITGFLPSTALDLGHLDNHNFESPQLLQPNKPWIPSPFTVHQSIFAQTNERLCPNLHVTELEAQTDVY